VVLVLISEESVGERWINFEAGVAVGESGTEPVAKAIPVCVRNFSKGKVGAPLGQLQVRSLDDLKDVDALLGEVATRNHLTYTSHDLTAFAAAMDAAVATLPRSDLSVEFYISDGFLRLKLWNKGNRNFNLISAWASVPKALLNPAWGMTDARPAWIAETVTVSGVERVRITLHAGLSSQRANPSFLPLPRVLTPAMSPYVVQNLQFLLGRPVGLGEPPPIAYDIQTEEGGFSGTVEFSKIAAS
jgi:hypothetical protein